MVDRTWEYVAGMFTFYKDWYLNEKKEGNEMGMEAVKGHLDAFMKGLVAGLNRFYIKKIWYGTGINDVFNWDDYYEKRQ